MAYYVDTSALVKLVVAEEESSALTAWFAVADRQPVACDLARTELMRAVRRADPQLMVRARSVLDSIAIIEVSTSIFETAGRLEPASVRSLDAVHVAAALELGDDLEGFVAYDERLAAAAAVNGIAVVAPL